MRVLLDTNFLLIPFQNRIDIFEEIERLIEGKVKFVILSQTLQELRSMKGRELLNARAMLDFIGKQSGKFEIINLQGKADDLIMKVAVEEPGEGFYVATMDKFLRDKLKKAGIKTIFVRGKGHLEIR
jgi:uncharacterized protein